MKKILITGGAGFIGSHVAEFYAKKGLEVRVFDNLGRMALLGKNIGNFDYNWNYLKKYKNVELVKGDIRNFDEIKKAAKDADAVIHCAAQTAVTTSVKNPAPDFMTNALGTFNVLEAIRQNDVKAMAYCSTNKVFGENVNKIKVKEGKKRHSFSDKKYLKGINENFSIDLCEHTPYGCSKLAGDLYCQDYSHLYGIRAGIFRMSCLTPDTKILTDEEEITFNKLEKSWKNTQVISFEEEKNELIRTNIQHFIKNQLEERKIIKVKTNGNRSIKATNDHLFFTPDGYKKLEDIKVNELVAVYPLANQTVEKLGRQKQKIVLNENEIREIAKKIIKRNGNIEKLVNNLKEKKLIPIKTNDKKVLVLARLLGFVTGDGNLSKTWDKKNKCWRFLTAFYGKTDDLKEIKIDLEKLGFKGGNIYTLYSKSELTTKHTIEGKTTMFRCGSSGLWILLVKLGGCVGDKSDSKFSIPKWVITGTKKIKAEYLGGFFGAELSKISWQENRGCFNSLELCHRKTQKNLKNGMLFFNQLRKILSEFGVQSKIRTGAISERKNGEKTIGIFLAISRKKSNIIKFSRIGYRYCKERQSKLAVASEFCNSQNSNFIEWHKKYVNKLGETGLVWDTISSKEEVANEEVRDLTVEKTHNFIANGFLVHNCIYGTRQFGFEDQGWIAWFTIAALTGKAVTIFGDGKQVRDVLFVDDVVRAYDSFLNSKFKSEVFTTGGGPKNTLSLLELIDLLENETGKKIEHKFSDWRPSDQKVYISDISKLKNKLNWEPKVSPKEGVKRLIGWVKENKGLF